MAVREGAATGARPSRDRRSAPATDLDAPRAVLWLPALTSLVVLGLAGLATYGDPDRRWVMLAVAAEKDALPAWWSSVLYVLVALACLLRARADSARARSGSSRAVRGRSLTGALAWVALAVLLTVLSVDHVLGLHNLMAGDPRLTALPSPVAAHPVQSALVLAALPVVLALLLVTSPRQGLLLVAAGALYLASGLLLDQRIIQPSWNQLRVETAELALEWAGALVLMGAAMARVRMSARQPRAG